MEVEPVPGDYFVTATAGRWIDRMAARIIQWDTDSPVNHAGLYVGDGTIVEAVGKVRYGDISEYPDAIWSTGRLPALLTPTLAQRREIVNAAHNMIDDPYNWVDLLAVGLAQQRTHHLVTDHTWWAKRLSRPGREICSQVVDVAYLSAGVHLFDDGRLPGLVAPSDLNNLLLPAAGVPA